ncbi:MFS transporter [Halobellus clavatus]|uniref:Predicted arabinose efflux permease, MFS family n=1 Tax=Halobellus clavatus TaxID=660517 RepID=A0A1H3D5V1_9EURY|nr:MFS transporter [Halobellus clavatus]SDX61059.1 Predicted arabinose efflux permease, MFS family [Halobellus clavatus]
MIRDTDSRVIALGLARMADALGNSFLIIVLPLYIASGQVSIDALVGGEVLGFVVGQEFLIGLVLSLFGFLNSFGQPFTGRLSDRLGRRKAFVLFGLVLFAIGSVAYPFLSDYWSIVVARGFQGIGAAFSVPATVALVNDYARSDSERGGNFGVFNTFRLIGFGFGPIVAGIVIRFGPYATPLGTLSGFNAAFGIAVLGALVSFALVYALVNDPPAIDAEAGDDLSVRILGGAGPGALDSVFVLGLGTFFMATTIALFAPLEAPIRARLGEGTFLFSVQFAAVVIANVLLQIPIGNASDTYGRRPFLLAGFVILIPSVLAQGYVSTPFTMLAARLLQGVAVALVFAPSLALAGDLARKGRSGTTLSILTMAFGLGVAVGPLAAGFLYNVGSLATPFTVGAAAAVVALLLVYTQVRESLSDEPGGPAMPTAED